MYFDWYEMYSERFIIIKKILELILKLKNYKANFNEMRSSGSFVTFKIANSFEAPKDSSRLQELLE